MASLTIPRVAYDEIFATKVMKIAPRMGNSNNFALLASEVPSDQFEYTSGLVFLGAFFVVFFFMWTLALIAAKYLGEEKVGFFSGDAMKPVDLKTARTTLEKNRPLFVRSLFCFAGLLWLIFVIIFLSVGIGGISDTKTMLEGNSKQLDSVISAAEIVHAELQAMGDAATIRRDGLVTDLKSICPNRRLGSIRQLVDAEATVSELSSFLSSIADPAKSGFVSADLNVPNENEATGSELSSFLSSIADPAKSGSADVNVSNENEATVSELSSFLSSIADPPKSGSADLNVPNENEMIDPRRKHTQSATDRNVSNPDDMTDAAELDRKHTKIKVDRETANEFSSLFSSIVHKIDVDNETSSELSGIFDKILAHNNTAAPGPTSTMAPVVPAPTSTMAPVVPAPTTMTPVVPAPVRPPVADPTSPAPVARSPAPVARFPAPTAPGPTAPGPTAPGPTAPGPTTGNNPIEAEIESAITALTKLEDFIATELDDGQNGINAAMKMAQTFSDSVNQAGSPKAAAIIFAFPWFLVPFALVLTVALVHTGKCKPRMVQIVSKYMMPFFCLLTLVSAILAVVMVSYAIANADFCSGGKGGTPEETIMQVLKARGIAGDELMFTATSFYVTQCPSTLPFPFVFLDTYKTDLSAASSALASLETTITQNTVQSIVAACGTQAEGIDSLVSTMNSDLKALATKVDETLTALACDTVVPTFTNTAYVTACNTSVHSLYYGYCSFIVMAFAGMIMITLRTAYLSTESEEEANARALNGIPADIETGTVVVDESDNESNDSDSDDDSDDDKSNASSKDSDSDDDSDDDKSNASSKNSDSDDDSGDDKSAASSKDSDDDDKSAASGKDSDDDDRSNASSKDSDDKSKSDASGKDSDDSDDDDRSNASSKGSDDDDKSKSDASGKDSDDDDRSNASSKDSDDDNRSNASNNNSNDDDRSNASSNDSDDDNASSKNSDEDDKSNASNNDSDGDDRSNASSKDSSDDDDRSNVSSKDSSDDDDRSNASSKDSSDDDDRSNASSKDSSDDDDMSKSDASGKDSGNDSDSS